MKNRAGMAAFVLLAAMACQKNDRPDISLPTRPPENIVTVEPIARNPASEHIFEEGNDRYIIGFTQKTANNQDAYMMKISDGVIMWARYMDKSPDDTRGEAITKEGNRLVVAFSLTGGNADFRATSGCFQPNYGSGGGPEITYLAIVDPANGIVRAATFIGCRLNNGNTNTLKKENGNPCPITFTEEGNICFIATKAYDRGDGRLTPQIGPDPDCHVSGARWIGIFNDQMSLLWGDCLPD